MDQKILLVADDDEMSRKVIKRFLSQQFEVLEADDGRKALEIMRSRRVDALLLDIVMPEMSGFDVLKSFEGGRPNPYMGVLVATSTKERTEREALALGADDVVAKPYDPMVIGKRLENILAMKDAQRDKDQLLKGNTGAADSVRTDQLTSVIADAAVRLRKIVRIINCSRDNPSMISEMTENILRETEKLENAAGIKG